MCIAKVSEVEILSTTADNDPAILELLKFAEIRVNTQKGKSKRMSKGQKCATVFRTVSWVCISTYFDQSN